MGLTGLGIFHTAIGVAALAAAGTSFVRFGKIDMMQISGKIYFYTTAITAVTALGISKSGSFNAGHIFSIFILLLVLAAFWLSNRRKHSGKETYVEIFLLSLSFFLSLIPTVNETFTRIPLRHPLAKSAADPVIAKTLLVLLIVFISGSVYQYRKTKKSDQNK